MPSALAFHWPSRLSIAVSRLLLESTQCGSSTRLRGHQKRGHQDTDRSLYQPKESTALSEPYLWLHCHEELSLADPPTPSFPPLCSSETSPYKRPFVDRSTEQGGNVPCPPRASYSASLDQSCQLLRANSIRPGSSPTGPLQIY